MTTLTLSTMSGDGGATRFQQRVRRCYYAEVPTGSLDEQSRLIEQVIRFAFDTLGASHLDVRVVAAPNTPRAIAHDGEIPIISDRVL